ncbi:hypothetical protein GA0074692_4940 [Micromonospora pallida]|uniref:Uncharacterized protein n=1 Tax=Micromonospora pallida TaxID=145854 RepID=A0A1C6T8X8_9ACTN|nr:hypothetical protein [Micromonospora pallida]SCL38224.1 hypothetical protein GA0074692_4940 [Micromonospora pallida]
MSYRQALDAAIGDSPVSTVDVDRIISGQRRARKLRIWGASGAGAAAVLAVTLTVALLPGSTTSNVHPATGPEVTTTVGTTADLLRMESAVNTALMREASNITFLPRPQPGNPVGDQTSHLTRREIEVDGVRGTLTVRVTRYMSVRFTCSPPPASLVCRPDGTLIRTAENTRSAGNQPHLFRSATALRENGEMVTVYLAGDDAQGRLSLTAEQLTAVATDPAVRPGLLPPGVEPKPAPTDLPTAPHDEAQQERIDNAVLTALRRQAPGVGALGVDGNAADLKSQWTGDPAENTVDHYQGEGRITIGGVPGLLAVRIARMAFFPGCGEPSTSQRCAESEGPGGERINVTTDTARQTAEISAERHVWVMRKDGLWVIVLLTSNRPDGTFALTEQQQKAIALDPEITLGIR